MEGSKRYDPSGRIRAEGPQVEVSELKDLSGVIRAERSELNDPSGGI